ncbi:hypothetical protein D3C87_1567970 [compost metagenome]
MSETTRVVYDKRFQKQLKKTPRDIQEKVQLWIYQLQLEGVRKTRTKKGYHDEPLQGDRWGQRSIRLNRSYRLIYEEIEDHVYIRLLEVHKHDY